MAHARHDLETLGEKSGDGAGFGGGLHDDQGAFAVHVSYPYKMCSIGASPQIMDLGWKNTCQPLGSIAIAKGATFF
jgi:hypothetical protein